MNDKHERTRVQLVQDWMKNNLGNTPQPLHGEIWDGLKNVTALDDTELAVFLDEGEEKGLFKFDNYGADTLISLISAKEA